MRLVTRSDFDGLICAILLREAGVIDNWVFVHPKDLQDGLFAATPDDVLANVPFVPGCGMWFDHHTSEKDRVGWTSDVPGKSRFAPSAARIVYEYYGGAGRFPDYGDMIAAVDKVDSGQLSRDEILNPKGWVLLGFVCDPRTGLGRFRNFTISNYQLMEQIINYCRHMTIGEILENQNIRERIDLYVDQSARFIDMCKTHTAIHNNVIMTDLRGVPEIFAGNRFLIYSIFPEQNVSMWIVDGKQKQNVSIACGYSVLNRTCEADIGSLMLKYGGGGHKQVGTCQVPYDDADKTIEHILSELME